MSSLLSSTEQNDCENTVTKKAATKRKLTTLITYPNTGCCTLITSVVAEFTECTQGFQNKMFLCFKEKTKTNGHLFSTDLTYCKRGLQ